MTSMKKIIRWRYQLNFKSSFEKLSSIQKIELYLLVLMLYGSIVYFYEDIFPPKQILDTRNNIELLRYQKELKLLNSKIIKKEELYNIKSLEDKAKEFNLFIKSLSIDKNCVNMQLRGDFLSLTNFLNYAQLYYHIGQFVFDKNGVNLHLNIKYLYNEKYTYIKIQDLANPFKKQRIKPDILVIKKPQKIVQHKDIKVMAILLDEVCIDNKWYKKKQIVSNYKILAINISEIEVLNMKTNKINILKLNNEI